MALGRFVVDILSVFKADTSDLRRKVKQTRREEKKLHKERLNHANEYNSKLDKQIAGWGKAAIAIGSVAAAWVGAKKVMNDYLEDAKLRQATQGISLDKLRKATRGLVDDVTLLQFAQKGLNSDYAATEQEMLSVARLAIDSAAAGEDLTEMMKALGDATAKGAVEELNRFGIVLTDTMGRTPEKGLKAYSMLMERAAKATGDMAIPGEEARSAMVGMQNSAHELKVALGELASHVLPLIAKALSMVAKGWRELIDMQSEFMTGGIADPRVRRIKELQIANRSLQGKGIEGVGWSPGGWIRDVAGVDETQIAENEAEIARLQEDMRKNPYNQKAGAIWAEMWTGINRGRQREQTRRKEAPKKGAAGKDPLEELMAGSYGPGFGFDYPDVASGPSLQAAAEAKRTELQLIADEMRTIAEQLQTEVFGPIDAWFAAQDSYLQKIFGPIEEFNLYKEAFDLLGSAVSTAYDAWISGSASAGEVFRKFLHESAKSLGKEMALQALRHAAYAAGYLAFERYDKAKKHGKAAAVFGLGAAAAGAIAKGTHSGGHAAGTAPGTYGGGGGGGGGQTQHVIVLAGPFAEDRHALASRVESALSYSDQHRDATKVVSFD